ncbi:MULTISPECIES: Tex family protein [Hydrocarboniphaga]|uniref:Tex protein n=1 Tax=Hydrocarboniphaga effusa AP103 TaxID=1172194 RepID=I8T733_9GAMM|nr:MULTISPECIES: Tex family protein [Hydrocarboniphaga]EIT69523.1 tex protein [Hydrocarboniphaga effusa AP103]MDZ4080805.1 Tex family protein [Hydrocarboniphaga sp.]MDZ4080884.1 Tex family protein [Hydrocarboniphaga sp.]
MAAFSDSVVRRIYQTIASDIAAQTRQVEAAVALLDEGATVPFIARYRKEVTGGLDDTQLRNLEERLGYLRELEERRAAVIESIGGQGKLTDDLEAKLQAATTKAEVEDLYLPYKPKRRTRAEIARENGLGPLAEQLLEDRSLVPQTVAANFVNDKVADVKAALDGARDILMERFAENAELLGRLRQYLRTQAVLRSRVIDGKQEAGAKFSDYFDHAEAWSKVASHRALAMMRGRNEDILMLELEVDADSTAAIKPIEQMIADAENVKPARGACDAWLMEVARWTWRVKLSVSLSVDLMMELRTRSEEEAIDVFARNLKDLLLAAPAGSRATIGLDPGIRTGVKVAVVDGTGKLLETATVYPFQPRNDVRGAQAEIARLIKQHDAQLIAIGNGTASRETEKLVTDLLALLPEPRPRKVIVSEAGASVYSASAAAAAEFPNLDVSLRGAVSIARRLQDPLAELVKIEPKSIGVGQYQHDVDQYRLSKALDAVVEDAVNAVGVDLNTASASLLARVSGVGTSLADAIVFHRDRQGAFRSRKQLLEVSRLGPKTFEQCAGFLRIRDGEEPLDASAVHPEAYEVARRIVSACGRDLRSLMGDSGALKKLDAKQFADERFGLPTVRDILSELEKPGRDPRPEFRTASFADGINEVKDLKPGMVLEGTVTNVAAFGAFVDIGVHQDGLVHVSQLADKFVKNPHEVVKAGDIVKVRVVDVDLKRQRIALSMRKDDGSASMPRSAAGGDAPSSRDRRGPPPGKGKQQEVKPPSALGAALFEALKK